MESEGTYAKTEAPELKNRRRFGVSENRGETIDERHGYFEERPGGGAVKNLGGPICWSS